MVDLYIWKSNLSGLHILWLGNIDETSPKYRYTNSRTLQLATYSIGKSGHNYLCIQSAKFHVFSAHSVQSKFYENTRKFQFTHQCRSKSRSFFYSAPHKISTNTCGIKWRIFIFFHPPGARAVSLFSHFPRPTRKTIGSSPINHTDTRTENKERPSIRHRAQCRCRLHFSATDLLPGTVVNPWWSPPIRIWQTTRSWCRTGHGRILLSHASSCLRTNEVAVRFSVCVFRSRNQTQT